MLVNFKELSRMGVINVTPNSFSDGGKHLDSENLFKTIDTFLSFRDLIFDFGFESTAPMNQPISSEEEKLRFNHFLSQVKKSNFNDRWVSFDTYKLQNFQYFYESFKHHFPKCNVILNDVSGVLDDELRDILKQMQKDKTFHYVYSATNIPSRSLVLSHPQFVVESTTLDDFIFQFKKAHEWFLQFEHLNQRIILDPALGFSKSFDQNWQIIEQFQTILDKLARLGINYSWIIGLSKKSFLRKKLMTEEGSLENLEYLHKNLIFKLKKNCDSHLIFRVHDPKVF